MKSISLTLVPHFLNRDLARESALEAGVTLDGFSLSVNFEFKSKNELLVLPSAGERKDGLWKNTCFELFLKPETGDGYWEVNVRPSGDWNAYAFDSYRDGMRPEPRVVGVQVKEFAQTSGRCRAELVLDLAPLAIKGKIKLGVTAVIEMKDGAKSYWAIHHAGEQPDFHLAASFTQTLEL